MSDTSTGNFGLTKNRKGISFSSPGLSAWLIKQKHSIFFKLAAAMPGVILGIARPTTTWFVVFFAINVTVSICPGCILMLLCLG